MKYNRILLAVAAFALLASCEEKPAPGNKTTLEVDRTVVNAVSDLPQGRNLVTETVTVTSNQSWSAAIVPEVDWLELETEGYENPSGESRQAPLVLKFKDNETSSERSATVKIACKGHVEEISVSQAAITCRLQVTTPAETFLDLSPYGTELSLAINCNTSWTVSVEEGATAEVRIGTSSGQYSALIPVTLASHTDISSGRTAVIVVSAVGCDSVRITLTQQAAPVVPGIGGTGMNDYEFENRGKI